MSFEQNVHNQSQYIEQHRIKSESCSISTPPNVICYVRFTTMMHECEAWLSVLVRRMRMGGVANVAYAMYIRPYICLICELDTVTLQSDFSTAV